MSSASVRRAMRHSRLRLLGLLFAVPGLGGIAGPVAGFALLLGVGFSGDTECV
jgi:hypothetical protein